jgi:hypothetical protein
MMKKTVSLLFAVMLSLVGISTTAWGAHLSGTEWLVDMSSQVSAGKAGNIKGTEPYSIEFNGTNFTLHSIADSELGFSGTYDEAPNGKTIFTPNPTELETYIKSKINAAAVLKGNTLSINDFTIKKVSSPSKVKQDFANLYLTYGLSVSFSYTGTLNGKDLKASGSLVMKAKGLLDDEGKSDGLPDTTWLFVGKETITLAHGGRFLSAIFNDMQMGFGSNNDFTITTNNGAIAGTYSIDDINNKVIFTVNASQLADYLKIIIEQEGEGHITGTLVTDVVPIAQATLSGDVMKFTGSATFSGSAYVDGVYRSDTGKYKVKAAGINTTSLTKEAAKQKFQWQ